MSFSQMGDALIEKEVAAVVGWDKKVSLRHTDSATELLIDKLLNQGLEVEVAVEKVMAEIGEDPKYGSKLLVHNSKI